MTSYSDLHIRVLAKVMRLSLGRLLRRDSHLIKNGNLGVCFWNSRSLCVSRLGVVQNVSSA